MIINQNQLEIRDVGFDDEKSFRIDEEEEYKIFSLLGNSIYSQKIESLVREVVSNSFDASVAAGLQDNPILVKYENNQIFFIDKGTGMSPDVIDKVYIRLGKSTKEQSNTQIGSFGVGKAATLSYATHYTLITNVDGVRYTYLISKGAKGKPNLSLIDECYTDEENGTTIIVDIPNKDYYRFRDAISNQLKYFRTVITEGFDLSNDQTIIQGKSFSFRPDRTNIGGLEINFGQIYYPIQWELLGIPRININCALYFPIDSGLIPIVSREQLENNEHNKKLILEKIEEFKKEIKELYKKQEIVEDFFEWKNSSDGIIELEGHRLNIYDVINSPRIWTPILNTNLNKDFKSSLYRFENVLMSYRPNKKSYNSGWWHTNSNNKIYYATSNISNQRLAKTEWNGLWSKREISPEMYISQYDLERVYDKSFYSTDPNTKETTWTIDYHSEFQYLADEIFKCVQKHSIDVHTIPIPKNISNKNSYGKEEIRAKIGQYWGKYSLSYFDKYRHVVYTTDEEEYNLWKNLSLNKRDRKNKQQDKIFIIFLTTSPHVKKLPDSFISPEEFINSDIIKNSFIRYKKAQLAHINGINTYTYENLHKMYRNRVNELKKNISWRNSGWGETNFPRWIEERLEKMYDVSHWRKQYEKRDKELAKYHYNDNYGNNGKYLKYKVLYQYIKKRYEHKSKTDRKQPNCN